MQNGLNGIKDGEQLCEDPMEVKKGWRCFLRKGS